MDDLSQQIASILSNPEQLNQLKQMAEGLFQNSAPEKEPEPVQNSASPQDTIFGNINIASLLPLVSQLNSNFEDERSRLLLSLKPLLSERRREKVDKAVKILRLLELLPFFMKSDILKNLL